MSDLNIKCYDNGGKSFDRYTVAYLDFPARGNPSLFECVACSEHPFHPQGFGQHTSCFLGEHLGKEVELKELPEDVIKLVHQDLL